MTGQPQTFTPKTGKTDGGQEARDPAAAVLTPASGASPVAPPLRARVGLLLGRSEVRIPAILDAAIQSQAEFTRQQAAKRAAASHLAEAVERIESLAAWA